MPSVTARGLVKRYGPLCAVDDVSFEVDAGEVVALLGPNGAGKTTTVEILEGFREADEGSAEVLGHPPGSRAVAERVGVMPQDGELYAGIRPVEALRQFASFYTDAAAPAELLERVGLADAARTNWRRLSGGQKQRLSLALALIGKPEVAFLDEPTAGMDVHARAQTWTLVRELVDGGCAVLLTTHLLEEAERVADRIVIVHRGRIVASGTPQDLLASNELTFRAPGDLDTSSFESRIVRDGPDAYRIPGVDADPALVARLTAWLADRGVLATEVRVGRRSLEDVFLELTR